MPRLVQRLLIKQAARPRALQAGMVSFKTTQLLVVGKTLLKHRANHLIHFQVLFDAKYANMLLECPAEKPSRNRGLSCLEVKWGAGGNGAG